jgi:release factor glutamine methyltransferase
VIALAEVLRLSTEHLERHGSPTARLDAELLLGHALGLSRVDLYVQHERPLSEPELARCRELVRRRAAREPVAYIVGSRGFRRLDLEVDPRVLVPRPETELVVERCLTLLEGAEAPAVLDVGTGSGAIALALKQERPDAAVTACDVSAEALAVAAANAERLGLAIELVESDLFAALEGRRFDLVVSNPPYIGESEVDGLEPEVRDHEPRLATVAGADGRELYRRLLPAAGDHLASGGWLVLECGQGQAGGLVAELGRLGYADAAAERDHQGIERAVWGRWA